MLDLYQAIWCWIHLGSDEYVISADEKTSIQARVPDHSTIAHFRKRHLRALVKLFTQVLRLCQKANLEKLGHIALDGTKVYANASKHKAMSHERMLKSEQELKREIGELLTMAQTQDKTKDKQFRKGMLGDELPEELQFKRRRLEKIREAKEALEREAQEKAEGKGREGAKRGGEKVPAVSSSRPRECRTGMVVSVHDPQLFETTSERMGAVLTELIRNHLSRARLNRKDTATNLAGLLDF